MLGQSSSLGRFQDSYQSSKKIAGSPSCREHVFKWIFSSGFNYRETSTHLEEFQKLSQAQAQAQDDEHERNHSPIEDWRKQQKVKYHKYRQMRWKTINKNKKRKKEAFRRIFPSKDTTRMQRSSRATAIIMGRSDIVQTNIVN